ncbi:MAG: hypothetical protein QF645_12665 [Planctomycetota bacterium]|jgi:hypothetical protein|nr:hypothetical protein [Planctomycetota bacterium]
MLEMKNEIEMTRVGEKELYGVEGGLMIGSRWGLKLWLKIFGF